MNKYRELLVLFKTFKKKQYLLTLLGTAQYACLAGVTFLIKFLIDYLQSDQIDKFIRITLISVALMSAAFFIGILNSYFWKKTQNEGVVYLRSLVFKGIIKKNPRYFVDNTMGALLSKVMNDVVIVAQTASIGTPMLQINMFRVAIVIVALFYLNIPLTAAIVAFIPVYYLLFNFINKKIRHTSRQERAGFSDIQSNIQETLSAIETVKIHRKEDYVQKQSNNIMNVYLEKYKALNRSLSIGSGLSSIFSMFLPILAIFVGAYLVLRQHMSVASLMSYYAFLPFLTEPVNNLSDYYLGTQTALGMSERVMEYLREDEALEGCVKIPSIASISFKDCCFGYNEQDNILNNFNLELKTGDRVAVLGKSGSGKSTILKLIIRFLTPTSGQVKINGIDINDVDIESYYSRIALLQQDIFLFKDTIRNNITFGDDYSDEQITRAALEANVLSIAEKLTGGLDYKIEEVGKNLSGGEQQRICLARALIRDTDLLLLDEPTSALDEDNERLLVDHIAERLSGGEGIFIVITHRKEILNACNKVVYFKNGQVRLFDLLDGEQRALLQASIEEEKQTC